MDPAAVERRRASVPPLAYPPGLPVSERKDDILAALRDHQVVVVAGETGSGKSTQLPKICLELGRGITGMIGHTQPRRLAARAVAERVAEELERPLGDVVGYTVRFTDRVGDLTLVKVMTDGILLAEIQRDRRLSAYDTIIIDEAHERSLNVDFLLGYLKQLLPRRPDLKVVVTSATIDTERFSAHFGGAPVIEVTGRAYPVEVRYRPLEREDDPTTDRDQTDAVCEAVVELCREGPGDILVFLSGEREIRDTAEAVTALDLPATEVMPLYARLSAAEQHRVFAAHPGRRVVLATNVAETSITVPGIRYVVDAGTARISRYNRRTKVQRLPIEPVAQAAADQRAGRCGRVAPGVCIRLYAEEDYLDRPRFTEPEILRTNLASVILQMAAIGLGDVAAFPFVDPPDERNIKDGVALLEELGAVHVAVRGEGESEGGGATRLTPMGRRLARLPVDPRLGRMVLEAAERDCAREVLILAAALSIQDPRERPADRRPEADEAHARFHDPESDFYALLNLWEYLREQRRERSSSQFRKMCRAEFLNFLRVREWQDVHSQLRQVAAGVGVHGSPHAADRNRVHLALLSGLLSQIGMRDGETREYIGARNARFAINPGSGLHRKPPKWVMAAELVETTRLWARGVARIQPEWAETVGGHLAKRSYGDPWWDAARGAAMTDERVTVYGLPVVTGRRISYRKVDPVEARRMFVQHALVEGDWETLHDFVAHNHAVIERAHALEHRVRRNDLVVGDDVLFAFHDRRVPPDVATTRDFDRWWKRQRQHEPDLLSFDLGDVLDPDAGPVDPKGFPDTWAQGALQLDLVYRYAPSAPDDGVTVVIPLPVLNEVEPTGLDWHVPGLRLELVTALIRALPKAVRRSFVPAAEHAAAFLARPYDTDAPLLDVLADHLSHAGGVLVTAAMWDEGQLPPHLRLGFRVVDEAGEVLDESDDLDALRHRLRPHLQAWFSKVAAPFERAGLVDWTVGRVPRAVEARWAGQTVRGYPTLVDEGTSVALRVLQDESGREAAMWAATRRLLLLAFPRAVGDLERRLPRTATLALARVPGRPFDAVVGDCVAAAADALVAEEKGPPWDAEAYASLRARAADRLADVSLVTAVRAAEVLDRARALESELARAASPALAPSFDDMAIHLARLVHPRFVAAWGTRRLPDVLRYLGAIRHRLDRVAGDVARDRARTSRIQALEAEYDRVVDRWRGALPPAVAEVRWMLEELRVSEFAQSLGTPQPVSEARIRRALSQALARA